MKGECMCAVSPSRSFDADTHRQGVASRGRKHTSCGAMPLRAGQLRRHTSPEALLGTAE